MHHLPPLHIQTRRLGKRHGKNWILRNLDLDVDAGGALAVLGSNGSGKSSLLRILCGFDAHSEGEVNWSLDGEMASRDALPGCVSYCAPDQSLIQDLTVKEHIEQHLLYRVPIEGMDAKRLGNLTLLDGHLGSRVRDLSSGMRQRLALGLAFSSDTAAVFLDEPTSHLDAAGRNWYAGLLRDHRMGRTIVVASNHKEEELPTDAMRIHIGA